MSDVGDKTEGVLSPELRERIVAAVAEALVGYQPPQGRSTLAGVGKCAGHAARRAVLLDALERNDWVLTYAARDLRLETASAIIHEAKRVGLNAALGAARRDGRIAFGRGPRARSAELAQLRARVAELEAVTAAPAPAEVRS
jgi:hypothetical protein